MGGTQRAISSRRKTLDHRLAASAFAACSCLVVGGGVPAPERIALKAGVVGTPLVLFEGGCGSEYFGQQAVYVRPDDVADIRRGVLASLDRKQSKSLAEHVCTYFSWRAVAQGVASGLPADRFQRSREMIAQIRPPDKSPPASPLARARRMVAETLLPERDPVPSWRQKTRKRLFFAGAVIAAAAAALFYFWSR